MWTGHRDSATSSASSPHTLQSKAGSVTRFEGEVPARNVSRYLAGHEPDAGFDGHTIEG
ncbi:hypothetical protein [Amycolatopsis decaplanina]|uniref:hypothetical protein n=1 Tax=Amycolatopsis decaplanina TaxID=208441 RepID=UPI000348DE29|nr:hypothetical protein [Amycolatopsis decaplanina]